MSMLSGLTAPASLLINARSDGPARPATPTPRPVEVCSRYSRSASSSPSPAGISARSRSVTGCGIRAVTRMNRASPARCSAEATMLLIRAADGGSMRSSRHRAQQRLPHQLRTALGRRNLLDQPRGVNLWTGNEERAGMRT
ncbi:hypothetical protein, partial [Pseudonocardia sp. Ae331_Ps2]|uniref:hypothetical protein n=1 Tax=Pseudonocardia sp. Ae331_Ps2 TaxID=1885031 RepID=UPI001C376477